MERISKIKYRTDYLLEFIVFLLSFTTIFALRELIGGKNVSLFFGIIFVLLLYHTFRYKDKIPFIGKVYIYALAFGSLLHILQGTTSVNRISDDLFARLIPIYVLSILILEKRKINLKLFSVAFLAFYIIECSLAIYEKITMIHVLHYAAIEDLQATSFEMLDSYEFRSFSLMLHPLYNANTVSVCLAFIIFQNIKIQKKIFLILLGVVALWAFNSRGAIVVWGILIIYRLLLFQRKLIYTLIILLLLYLIIPFLLDYIEFSGILGRVSSLDFSDGSSATRMLAYDNFIDQKWSLEDLLIGGRILYYTGTQVSLENGPLLDLGYWGIVIGAIKIVGELVLTYMSTRAYAFKQRIFIMISFWGVAFMNNNSYSTWLMAIFVLCLISFQNNAKDESFVLSK